MLKLMT